MRFKPRIGETYQILQDCIHLIDETGKWPVLVVAHLDWYAEDLAGQFAELCKVDGHDLTMKRTGASWLIEVDDHAKFHFISYGALERFGRGREFREVFMDDSIWSLEPAPYEYPEFL